MFECPYMVQAIHAAGLLMHPIIENGENWMEAMLNFFMSKDSHEVELYCVICYEIWNERNKAWQENTI